MTTTEKDVLNLAGLLADNITTDEADRVGYQLSNADQRLITVIRDCVAIDDASSLATICTGSRAVHKILAVVVKSPLVRDVTEEPFKRHESASVHAARALAALGLALVVGPERAGDHLRVFRRWIAYSGLDVPSKPVREVPAIIATPHAAVIRHLADAGELDLLSLVWMAELDGWLRRERSGPVRLGPSTQVLLDLGDSGQLAELSLSRVPGLPDGLIPDPATMTLCSADAKFRSSLATVWEVAGGSSSGAVLWSLGDQAGPVTRVTDESLGLAFTALLDEQCRLSRPWLGVLTVRRLRPRTAIVGRIDPTRPDAASSVSGYDAKLSVVGEKTRVVLPRADHRTAIEANRSHAQLVPVDTWRQAAKAGRELGRMRLLTIAAVVLLIVASTAAGLYSVSESKREADQRRSTAADLAARAVTLRGTDPTLAAKLGLAAHRIAPDNGRAVDALRDVLEDNRNVVRTWQADSSRLDSLAVSEPLDRVLTSGAEGVTKVWTLSSGIFKGQIPKHTFQMATAQSQALVAAVTNTGLALYDIGGDQPTELGGLPNATCTTEEEVAALGFTRNDTTLVAVWKDGAVSSYDVVTRQQTMCLRWQETLAPLNFFEQLPVAKVVAADVVGPAYTERADDEIMLVLTNNNVVSVRTGSRDARIEVPQEKITGDASLVAASSDTVSVATAQGVAVWKRSDQTLLVNPAGGLGLQPRVLVESNGHLLFSGETGTALVPLGRPSWQMAESLATPSGGAATVAAISDRGIVAGGPGGRVSVIADSSGELALSQQTAATGTTFLPDGRLIAAEVPVSYQGKSAGTYSLGLALVDPRAPKPKNDGTDPQPTRWVYGDISNRFYINAVAAAPDLVAAAGQVDSRGAVLVWPWDNHTSPRQLLLPPPDDDKLRPEQRIIATVEFTPDAKMLVARHVSGQVGIWATDTWQLLGTVDLRPGNVRMTVHSGRAIFLERGGEEAELVQVDLETLTITRRVSTPNVLLMSANVDGSLLVTMTEDGTVQIRGADLAAVGDPWRPLASGDPAEDVAVDSAGQRVAIAQGDQVLIYELDSKTLAMPPIDTDGNRVVNVNWSPDGELLIGTTMPPIRGNKQVNPLRVWKIGGLDWTNQICRWAGGGLTPAEWTRYVGDAVSFIDLCAEANR